MTVRRDAIFDSAQRATLERDVYGTTMGAVRLHVLWQDLLDAIPTLASGSMRIIDIGAGMGQIAQRIAALGHDVTVCDPSPEMLDRARTALHESGVSSLRFLESTVQELRANVEGKFDLVMCHAVLEWLAEPQEAINCMAPLLEPQGYLSLMFYNRNAAILKRAIRGDVDAALTPDTKREPPWPLDPELVRSWIDAAGLEVTSKAGIRIFHDHIPEEVRSAAKLDELLELEAAYRRHEPFASLGQHVHFICKQKYS
ncbi:MAG: methyltransferase domain-containing protein [Dehalococcoidia bacterium]